MALFPAYSENATIPSGSNEEWLTNTSFKIDVLPSKPSSHAETDDSKNHPKSKKRKKKLKKSKDKLDESPTKVAKINDDPFTIDTSRTIEYLKVATISRPAVAKYRIKYYMRDTNSKRKRKFKRYYKTKHDEASSKAIITKDISTKENSTSTIESNSFKHEEDLSKTTALYNQGLAENPHDISLWLKYVEFQDTVYQFEKTFRKGSISKGLRVMAERKIAILEKALSFNSECESLLRERLRVSFSVYPSDELQVQLKKLVEKEQGNIIYWQGYIEATQFSMSHCTTPSVLNLYTKCLSVLHKLRQNVTVQKHLLEENILRMLYQCGLFLKQAGLFEQLWTLLRLYLELNLSPTDNKRFNLQSGFNESRLIELEDIVFNSQLPLQELWLRTEKLREACHWLPNTNENCEDPQRIVLVDDVVQLIHPITMPENTFKLTSTILNLLKIPLLPCRHVTMHDLGLDYVSWFLDSIEQILPIFYNLYHIDLNNDNLLVDPHLSVGPQYLKVLPGQEEYLNFVFKIMTTCIDCLTGKDKIAVLIWWFRFQKLLIILSKENKFKIPNTFTDKIKSNIKSIMKQEAFRNNLQFYCEYALIEYELGNTSGSIKILTTALSLIKKTKITAEPDDNIIGICHVYKTLMDILMNPNSKIENYKTVALKHLVTFVANENTITDSNYLTQGSQNEAALKFKHITLQLLNCNFKKLHVVDHLLPNFFSDWIICNGWFIYLTSGVIECGKFIEKSLADLDEKHPGKLLEKEILFEFYIAVLFGHALTNPGFGIFNILDDVLHRGITDYPNNLFMLSILIKEQSLHASVQAPSLKLQNILLKTGRTYPVIGLILIYKQNILNLEQHIVDTITGKKFELNTSYKNKMLSLFKRVTMPDMCTRKCGLLWRLYLQFVHAHCNPTQCRNIYYTAVEECPWLKSLYIDAAIYIPAELPKIQDLLIEKQLRLHVTPEELDILRN